MHKNVEHTLPLFDILLAGSNLPTFNVKSIMDRALVGSDVMDSNDSDGTTSTTQQRSKWWFQRMQHSLTSSNSDDAWLWYRCYLMAFLVAVRTHRDLMDVGSFYSHKAQIQHDLVFLLRDNAQRWANIGQGGGNLIPENVRQLALLCVAALLERSEHHFTNAQKEGEWSGAVRLIPPFDSILQGQLGIDGGQIQGMAPSIVKQELQWMTTLPEQLKSANRDWILSRLQHVEGILVVVLTSLPLPKAIQAYINNGVIDSILAVMRLHNLYDLPTLYQMYCIASLQMQVLDMIISSKRGAMEAFYAANGPVLAMERLKFEASFADKAAVEQYIDRQKGQNYVDVEDSPLPSCYQSLVLSLTALLDSLLNNHNNREVRSGSHASLNQMDLVRSTLFGETIVVMCDGLASVAPPILTTFVRTLCELINNDSATPAVINLFLLQSPYGIIRKTYEAVSSAHIRHDSDTMASILNLVTALCIKEEGLRMINAANPFQVVLGIFKDPNYFLSESHFMHTGSFAVLIGGPCGDLLRSNPLLSPLFAQTFLGVMQDVVKLVTDFATAQNSRDADNLQGKTLACDDSVRNGVLSNVILGNMMIAVLTCFETVVERSKEFAKDFLSLGGGQCLYSFLSSMFGTRRHLLTTLGVKAVVTTEDRAGNNQLRRTVKHSYMKMMIHQMEDVMLDVTSRIQDETDLLAKHLAAFKLTVNTTEPLQDDQAESMEEDEVDEEEEEFAAVSQSSSSSKKSKKKGKPLSIQQLRANAKKKAALKPTKEVAAASIAQASSALRRSSTDLHLHNLLDSISDSTADLFAFDYTANDELFDVLYSLLRAEALFDLLCSLTDFAMSMPDNTAHKYLPVIIPALASAALVNVNCVSEIGRAHELVVARGLDREETATSDSDVNFDLYVIPCKQKMRLRDSIVEGKQSYNNKASSIVEHNSFLFATERICNEESKSLTFFRLRDGVSFIRKKEADGAPNVEIVAIRQKSVEEKAQSKAVYRRDQSVSLYRMGKNVLRAVCNAFNDLVGVVPTCFRGETDAAQLKASMELLRPALFDLTFKKILNWGYRGGDDFGVQKYLQFKYAVDICASFLNMHGSMHEHQADKTSLSMTGNPLSFASLYQHDKGVLFALFIKSCCVTINGCYPAASSGKDERLQMQERVFCVSIASKVLSFLRNVLHCLGTADSGWGRDLNTKHHYPKPNEVKYNCFITLYEHLKSVWAHPQLYSLPAHLSLSVVELLAQFQECGHKVYLACCTHSDDDILNGQLAYLQSLGATVEEDSVRMFLNLAQRGGMHFEGKHSSFQSGDSAADDTDRSDPCIPSKLWPLNTLAAEENMKRADFLRQLVEMHVKGQVAQITVTHKPYKCETTLEFDIRNIDKGVCAAIEKQYKVATSTLTLLLCHLATALKNAESRPTAMDDSEDAQTVDFQAIEGLLVAMNVILYVSGTLFTNICPPFQNAITLLLTIIPEFAAVFADVSALLEKETNKFTFDESRTSSALQQPQFRWIPSALMFLDTAIQPFLTTAPLLNYCEMLSKSIAASVKLYHSSFIQEFDCSAQFSNASDQGTIEVLLQTTPVQHFFAGNKKNSCTLSELMAAAEDAASVNASYVTPMAQLRESVGVSVVQSCVRILREESDHAVTATKSSPLLMQSALQVMSHLARDTAVAKEVLIPDNLRTVLNVSVGFERLSLYLSSVVQTAVEQTSGEALLRVKMQRALLSATEVILESELQSGCSEQRLRFRFAKHIGKFMSVVEGLMMRDANVLLSVLTDRSLFAQIHNPVAYIAFPDSEPEDESNDWRSVLRGVNQAFMLRISQLQLIVTGTTAADETAVCDARCLLGDLLVCIADLLHSLLPEQAHYLLSGLVSSNKTSLQSLLLVDILPQHALTVNTTTQALENTLEWSKKRNNTGASRKEANTMSVVATSKLYASGIYLLVSFASLEGAARCQLLSEVSLRLKAALQVELSTERSASDVRSVVCVLDFLNAIDVPHYNPALSGITFIVPADSILAALSAANVHSDLIALQDAELARGGQSALTQSLTTAVNLLMLRGVSAANEVARFVATCKDLHAAQNDTSSSSSSSSEVELPFWGDDLYLYTNIFDVARRANNHLDKIKRRSSKQSNKEGAGGVTISASSRGGDVRGYFNGVMTAFGGLQDDEEDDQSNNSRPHMRRGLPPPPQAVQNGSHSAHSGSVGENAAEQGDDEAEDSSDELDHYSDLDEDEDDFDGDDEDGEEGGAQGSFSDEEDENDFIDDEDDEGGGMGMGGPHGMWQQIGHLQGHFQNWAGGGENDRGDHSDISMDSDDEGGGMHDLDEDDDLDDFDMMSAPPDSDDDDDSELNEGGSHHGDDCTIDGSMIFIDDSEEGAAASPIDAQEGDYMTLAAHIKLDNDIYHMIGYLSYNEALEPKSVFDNMLGPLLGDKKEVHFGRTDFRHLAQATGQGRVGLGCPQASRRVWNTDIDFVNALLNSVVLMPFFSYLVLQDEYSALCETMGATWKDTITSALALEALLKALTLSTSEEKIEREGDNCVAYNLRAMNKKVRSVADATSFGGLSFNSFIQKALSTEVTALSIGSTVVDSFVASLRRYGDQQVVANFNRHLNMKSMSLFKLCLATSRVVRNYQMSLIFLYSAMDRTRDWDQALFDQLMGLLLLEDSTEEGMSYSDRLVLAFETLSYQCDEMYRNAERVTLALRHALLTAPPLSATSEAVSESPSDQVDSSVEAIVASASPEEEVTAVEMVSSIDAESAPPRESVLGRMLDALHVAVQRGVSSGTVKDLLRIVNHLLTLCEKESSSVSIKVNETFALRLFVPVIKSETMGSLCGLFLRDDLFVSSEHYLAHFSRLMNFLCQNKTNWLSLVACSQPIGETLMSAVAVDTKEMLAATKQQISLSVTADSSSSSSSSALDSPTKTARSVPSSPAPLINSTELTADSATEDLVVLVAKPARQTVQFHSPNAELRLVHFFDLLQSTTTIMNNCGVVVAKKSSAAAEPPPLNGTKEDLQTLNQALIHLQESVVWDDLIQIMRQLNLLIMSGEDAAPASDIIKPSKLSAYGSIAAEHLRMVPLIESLFQVATLPTVLFNHVAPLVSDKQHAVFDAGKTATKTPMIFRDVSVSASKAKGREGAAKQTIRLFDCYVTSKLFTLVEENKKLLNTKLNQNIRLLELSLQAMRTVPELSKFLDFSVKRKYLRLQIKRLRRPMKFRDMTEEQRIAEQIDDSDDENEDENGGGMEEEDADNVSVMVDRDDVLNQSFHCVQNYSPRQFMRGNFHVTFNNEPGMDAGGLTREWLLILTRCIFKPAYALFSLSGDGVTYQPNPHSGANPEHLDYFKFIGRLVAKAVCDNQLLDVHFTRSFYKHILRVPISFSDLEAFDKEYYKSLNALLQHNLEDLGLELTFTVTANVFGTEVCSNLVEDGENVAVTDENKAEYVRLIAHHCLTTSFQKQIDAFLDGFHELLPHSLFSHFDPSELELLISGLPEVDIEDLHAHTTYTGYKQSDAVIQRFWNVLRKFSNEEKALFVQFVTGTSKVPLDGFQSLQGSEGVQMFGIHKAYNEKLLPTAHTCFNQLDLPEYPSEEVMRDKLVLAIRECSEGFGFQ
eukprot:gene21941-28021_t